MKSLCGIAGGVGHPNVVITLRRDEHRNPPVAMVHCRPSLREKRTSHAGKTGSMAVANNIDDMENRQVFQRFRAKSIREIEVKNQAGM